VDRIEKAVAFDRDTCRWTIVGEAFEVQRSAQRAGVLRVLANAQDGMPTDEIIAAAHLQNRRSADTLLSRMAEDGEIERLKRGRYGLPGTRSSLLDQKGRQKDRTGRKAVQSEEDEHLSVDLSSFLTAHRKEHENEPNPSIQPESKAGSEGAAMNAKRSASTTLDLDIPTFLKRGHRDCILDGSTGHEESQSNGSVGTSASVPFMITISMKARLAERGYTRDEIATMTPMEAHQKLAGSPDGRSGK
jgi:hypothetical protein